MKVSLVVPCFNEEGNLPRLFTEIDAMANRVKRVATKAAMSALASTAARP